MKRCLISLVVSIILATLVNTDSVAQEPSDIPDMKFWVEVRVASVKVRTCPSERCPVIRDPKRPALVQEIPPGGRVKGLEYVETAEPRSCVDPKCRLIEPEAGFVRWIRIDEGYIDSTFVEEIPHPEALDGYICPLEERKCVVVDTRNQSVHLIQDGVDRYRTWVSTGSFSPTPNGLQWVGWKLKVRRMRGGVPGTESYFDLCCIPHVTYFTGRGDAFHGTYWHTSYGLRARSHGCVNMTYYDAEVVYDFVPLGTLVVVR